MWYKTSFKYSVVIRPLCIKLPQMFGYVRKFKGNATMSFKINDKQL